MAICLSNKRGGIDMKQIDLNHYKKNEDSPFKIPESYFEDFVGNLMKQIPDNQASSSTSPMLSSGPVEEKVTLFSRIKPYLYLAAMISGLAFGVKVYKYQQQYFSQPSEKTTVAMTDEQAEQYVDYVCDFAMFDGNDVYACATDNY